MNLLSSQEWMDDRSLTLLIFIYTYQLFTLDLMIPGTTY